MWTDRGPRRTVFPAGRRLTTTPVPASLPWLSPSKNSASPSEKPESPTGFNVTWRSGTGSTCKHARQAQPPPEPPGDGAIMATAAANSRRKRPRKCFPNISLGVRFFKPFTLGSSVDCGARDLHRSAVHLEEGKLVHAAVGPCHPNAVAVRPPTSGAHAGEARATATHSPPSRRQHQAFSSGHLLRPRSATGEPIRSSQKLGCAPPSVPQAVTPRSWSLKKSSLLEAPKPTLSRSSGVQPRVAP